MISLNMKRKKISTFIILFLIVFIMTPLGNAYEKVGPPINPANLSRSVMPPQENGVPKAEYNEDEPPSDAQGENNEEEQPLNPVVVQPTNVEQSQTPAVSASPEEMTKQAIRNQVKVMRQARFDKMPYLNRGIIRENINEETIKQRVRFTGQGPSNLETLIGRAVEVSSPARAARQRVSLAKRKIIAALRTLFPEFSIDTQIKDGSLSGLGFNSRTWKATFKQPVFHGGIIWNSLLKENCGLQVAQKGYDRVVADLIRDVAKAYFDYIRAVEIENDYRVTVEKTKRFVEMSEQKWKAQIVSEIEHLNAQSLYSQMQYDYESAKQDFELAKLELQRLLDLSLSDEISVRKIYDIQQILKSGKLPREDKSLEAAANQQLSADRSSGKAPEPHASAKEAESAMTAEEAIRPSDVADETQETQNAGADTDLEEEDRITEEEQNAEEQLDREEESELTVPDMEESEIGRVPESDIPDLEVLVDLAYQNRPELQVESAKLQQTRLQERIAYGKFLPQVDVVMEYGRLGEAYNELSLDPKMNSEFRFYLEMNWNIIGNKAKYAFENNEQAPSVTQYLGGAGTATHRNGITFGVLDGLQDMVDAMEKEVEKLDQIVELENAEKEVVHDLKKAFFEYQRALVQVKSSVKRCAYKDHYAAYMLHRLERKEIEIGDYLQAEIEYVKEKNTLHTALRDYFTAKAELNRAVGIRNFLPIEESYGK
ncbi:MAG: TolC family protein [Candidatus Omnitrophica bacterium]|nr:TolC family protein [Candidatus Omnitrophota bacterium]MDD5671282.1 TolC family protein [Candidatus Omnitrophota bacterium]